LAAWGPGCAAEQPGCGIHYPLSGTGLYHHLPSASSRLAPPTLVVVPEVPEATKTRSLGSPALSACSQRAQWSPRARRVGLPLHETLGNKPRGRAQGQTAWASGRGVGGRPQVLIWWGARAISIALGASCHSRAVSCLDETRPRGPVRCARCLQCLRCLRCHCGGAKAFRWGPAEQQAQVQNEGLLRPLPTLLLSVLYTSL
jgi:hypothetical protein